MAAAALLLGGCRTYGRYDAQEKMLPEMQQSVRLFSSDLERAMADLELLRQAASGESALGVVVQEYEQAVAQHEAMLDENQRILERFQEDLPSYRKVHRTFGAILSEHQIARNRYRSLVQAVRYPSITQRMAGGPQADSSAAGSGPPRRRLLPDTLARSRDDSYTEGRYYVAPIFYERLQSATGNLTMRQALSERSQRQSQQGRLARGTTAGGERLSPSPIESDSAGTF